MRNSTPVLLLTLAPAAAAQFSEPSSIADMAANSVFAIDIDGDGDSDLLSASAQAEMLTWHENVGGGAFGASHLISDQVSNVNYVIAADLDGDGDADVLSAPWGDGEIAWYENLGAGSFGPQQVIVASTGLRGPVRAADLDGDFLLDIIAPTGGLGEIAWYANLGSGSFAAGQVITTAADLLNDLHTADLDGDGDQDLLSASGYFDSTKIAWYENLGGGSFGPGMEFPMWLPPLALPVAVDTADIDGDGDQDVVAASSGFGGRIVWWENLAPGVFGPEQWIEQWIIDQTENAQDIRVIDLDGDEDPDVLLAALGGLAWFENRGAGSFVRHFVAEPALSCIDTADFDGDGDTDFAFGSIYSSADISWCAKREVIPLQVDDTSSPLGWQAIVWDCLTWCGPPEPGASMTSQLSGSLGLSVTSGPTGITELQFAPSGDLLVIRDLVHGPNSLRGIEVEFTSGSVPVDAAGNFDGRLTLVIRRGRLTYTDYDYPLYWNLAGIRSMLAVRGNLTMVGGEVRLTMATEYWFESLESIYPCFDCGIEYCATLGLFGELAANSSCLAPEIFCDAAPNSTGQPGQISSSGSTSIHNDEFTLAADHLPPHQFGFFVMSNSEGSEEAFSGGQGTLCTAGSVVRFTQNVLLTDAAGSVSLPLELQKLPDGVEFEPGSRWNFQFWHRDDNPTPTTNLTTALSVTWCP